MTRKKADIDNEIRWTKEARRILKGKIIDDVRLMTHQEAKELGYYSRTWVISISEVKMSEKGSRVVHKGWIWAQSDDEGNDVGAIATMDERVPTLPVF